MKVKRKHSDEGETSTPYTPSKSEKKCNRTESPRNRDPARAKRDEVTSNQLVPLGQSCKGSDWYRYLLSRTETQWQFGAWDEIVELSLDDLSQHPERARLALLVGSAHLQLGHHGDGKVFLESALKWGCEYEKMVRIVVSGVHNSLGRALTASRGHGAASPCFEKAIRIGAPSVDLKLVADSRLQYQADHLRKVLGAPYARNDKSWKSESFPEESWNLSNFGQSVEIRPQYSNDKIKVFGPPRSGTNYLRALLEWNAECTVIYSLAAGWKHEIVSDDIGEKLAKSGLYSVHLVKNPLAQILSLYRYNKNVGRNIRAPHDWHTFLRSPFILTNDDRDPHNVEHRFRSPADYWNSATWSAWSYVQKNSATNLIIRYEDLLDSPETNITRIASLAGLRFRDEIKGFAVPSNTLHRMGDGARSKHTDYVTGDEFDVSYYSDESYRSEFSADDVKLLEKDLDSDLMAQFGYIAR